MRDFFGEAEAERLAIPPDQAETAGIAHSDNKVERWAIDRLIPYAKNARTHSPAQIAAIAASIKEWGWTTPALVGEDGADRIGGLANLLLGSTKPRRCFST
ncbi:MAG TPA: hypothetical protein VNY32_00235, partial [Candidatus Acidoferrales bacterium]|nr:hypothetical protein [Candidatus Acidoferrales bacterium]